MCRFAGNDNQDINDAFRAAMAYDPALPSSEQEVLVRQIMNIITYCSEIIVLKFRTKSVIKSLILDP